MKNKFARFIAFAAFAVFASQAIAGPIPSGPMFPAGPAGCLPDTPAKLDSFTTKNANGQYDYSVTAFSGTSQGCPTQHAPAENPGFISDLYIPYFSDMEIANVQVGGIAGDTWTYGIEDKNDLFGIGGGVLHFHTADNPMFYPVQWVQIGFTAQYDSVSAPYGKTYQDSNGDFEFAQGAGLAVASPLARQALGLDTATVPEPGSIALIGLGVIGFVASRRKRV